VRPKFKDVAEKISQYQELRTDDRVKDYLTASMDNFYEICKSIVNTMNMNVRDITDVPNGCQFIAVEEEQRWVAVRKMPKLIRFLRVTDMITESSVRALYEEMKKLNIPRGIIFSSSNFSRKALDFSETRPIDLYGKEHLQEVLKKVEIPQHSSRR
ncbi:MAG: restriction endonuclease, partial [Spirochaetes bacterium]